MNSFGTIFRVSIYGESHGESVGVVIDGCPPGISLTQEDFLEDLKRSISKEAFQNPEFPEFQTIQLLSKS